MQVNIAQRMTEKVTVVHLFKAGSTAQWRSQTVEGAWQTVRERSTALDGTVQFDDTLRVQIPEDQGDVRASLGDWLVRGEFTFAGNEKELREALPESSRRVSTVRDLRGGISGNTDPLTRYASALVLESR